MLLRTLWPATLLLGACAQPDPGFSFTEPSPEPTVSGRVTLGEEQRCAAPAAGLPGFDDRTGPAGIGFVPTLPELEEADRSTATIEGSGGFVVADLNGDGLKDLLFSDLAEPLRMHLALGDLEFRAVPTAEHGIELGGALVNALVAVDIEGDGDLDLYVGARTGGSAWLNDGQGHFLRDEALGLSVPGNIFGSTWADVDRDGDLDAYIFAMADTGPEGALVNQPDWLLENTADGFVDRSDALLPPDAPAGQSFAASFFDGDLDGRLDLLVVHDGAALNASPPNRYFANRGGWGFEELIGSCDQSMLAMGLALGDLDNDGDLDLHITDAGPTTLLRNEGGHLYTDISLAVGGFSAADRGDISWGTTFFDHDNDGRLELATAFGHMPTKEDGGPVNTANRDDMPDQLWRSEGGEWVDIAAEVGVDDPSWTRTMQAEDLNGDGFAELITWSLDGGPRLHVARCNDNAWLEVELLDEGANPHGIGARVEAYSSGAPVVMRALRAGGESALSGGSPTALLGLGDQDVVDLRVVWPNGDDQLYPGIPTRRAVRIQH